MCYTCSSSCDNCRPKMVECPHCGHINMLSYDVCQHCSAPITDDAKARALALWDAGTRFGKSLRSDVKPMSRTNSPFAAKACQ